MKNYFDDKDGNSTQTHFLQFILNYPQLISKKAHWSQRKHYIKTNHMIEILYKRGLRKASSSIRNLRWFERQYFLSRHEIKSGTRVGSAFSFK